MTPIYSQNADPAIPSLLQKNNLSNTLLMASQDMTALRRSLDTNISAIYQQIKTPTQHSPITPTLNSGLVREYIRFVYQQYNIRDPLTNVIPNYQSSNTTKMHQNCLPNPKNSHRKAVHLKENFLIEMLSPSDQYQSVFNQQQLSNKQRSTQLSSPPRKIQRDTQIKEEYRYCFVCQEPILQTNIEIHEKIRCPQFSNLYDMSIGQLKELVLRKIHNIKNIIQSYLQKSNSLGNQTMNRLLNIEDQAIQYINALNQNLSQPKNLDNSVLASRKQVRHQFDCTMESFETIYFQLYAELRKLQWFVNMHFNIQCKYGHLPFHNQSNRGSP